MNGASSSSERPRAAAAPGGTARSLAPGHPGHAADGQVGDGVGVAASGTPGAAPSAAAGAAANERLTSLTGALLLVLLVAMGFTVRLEGPAARQLLPAHFLLGLLLLPPLALKLASTGYRFVRYYSGSKSYRQVGPPPLFLRVLGPVVVLSSVALFATGVELWLFGTRFGASPRFGTIWRPAHLLSFVVWLPAMAIHVLGHLRQSARAVVEEVSAPAVAAPWRQMVSPRSLVVGSLLLGAVLAAVSLLYHTPFVAFLD